ncbi:MAG: lipopolysaccharide biosynthesis protein, partial [Actinomycetota bacterium]
MTDEDRGAPPESPKQMTRRTLDSLAWSSSGALVQTVLQFGVLLVLARLLTPADFGVVGAATLVLGFSQVFWQLGVGPAIIQRPTIAREHVETAFTSSVVLGLVFATGMFFLAPVIAEFFRIPRLTSVLRVSTAIYLVRGGILVAESLLRRELHFKQIAIIQFSAYVAYGVVSITAAALGAGVWALVTGYIAQSLTEAILVLKSQPHSKRLHVHRSALREMLSFGSGITAAQIANYCALQGDNFVVGRLLGARSLGIYGRSYNLMAMPANLFASAVDTVLFPAMSRVQSEPQRLAAAFRRAVALTALVALPLSAITYVLAPEVVDVLLGEQWGGVVPVLRILALGIFFRTAYKLGASVARAKGKVHQIAWRQGAYGATVIGGAWIAGSAFGLRGVAWAVLASLGLIFVLLMHLALRVTGVSARDLLGLHLPPLVLSALILGVSQGAATLARSAEVPSFLILV